MHATAGLPGQRDDDGRVVHKLGRRRCARFLESDQGRQRRQLGEQRLGAPGRGERCVVRWMRRDRERDPYRSRQLVLERPRQPEPVELGQDGSVSGVAYRAGPPCRLM
jgi:hypothetical protein